MMTKEMIDIIRIFMDSHEKIDPPLFVYYEPIKINENGDVNKNTGFLTTMDESMATKYPYVTFYGEENAANLNMRMWLRDIVPPSEIETLDIYETISSNINR